MHDRWFFNLMLCHREMFPVNLFGKVWLESHDQLYLMFVY